MSAGEQGGPGSGRAAVPRTDRHDEPAPPGHSGPLDSHTATPGPNEAAPGEGIPPPTAVRGRLVGSASTRSGRHATGGPDPRVRGLGAKLWRGRREPADSAPPAESDEATPRRPGRSGRSSFLRELPVLVLVAFVLALLIKAFLVQAFWIPSESMERTLLIDDRVLVNKVIYRFRDVHRGEVVVFNGEGTNFESGLSFVEEPGNVAARFLRGVQDLLGLGAPSEKDFIKRVIAVGGDTVACCDDQGRVTVNGQGLDEPYVFENNPLDQRRFDPVTVPEGQLWVMGDHRSDSSDSRSNGPIPEDKVIGRAFVKVWPLSRVGLLQVPEDTFDPVPGPSVASGLGAPEILAGIGLVVAPVVVRRRRRVARLRDGPPPPGRAVSRRLGGAAGPPRRRTARVRGAHLPGVLVGRGQHRRRRRAAVRRRW